MIVARVMDYRLCHHNLHTIFDVDCLVVVRCGRANWRWWHSENYSGAQEINGYLCAAFRCH